MIASTCQTADCWQRGMLKEGATAAAHAPTPTKVNYEIGVENRFVVERVLTASNWAAGAKGSYRAITLNTLEEFLE
ncbi:MULTISPECIES: hypothetical protein [Paraburkholderia]|uniref:hypothetical protein n=1 Tax=Paraburkholderia TaxID=1822464 RepID=UPI0038BA75AC